MTRKLSLIIKIHQFVVLWIQEIILLTLYLNFSQFRMDYGRIYWLGIILNQSKSLILVKHLKKRSLYAICPSSNRVLIFKFRDSERVQFQNGTS